MLLGINFADLMMRQGLYGSAPEFPFTPGYEVSGVISELGPKVKNLQIDQRVIGLTGFGGYSEEVIIDSNESHIQYLIMLALTKLLPFLSHMVLHTIC